MRFILVLLATVPYVIGSTRSHSRAIGSPLLEAQAEAAYAAMCSAAPSTAGQQAIAADVSNALGYIKAITSAFSDISGELAVIDSQNLTTVAFTSLWGALQNQWSSLLSETSGQVYLTHSYVSTFVELWMPLTVKQAKANNTSAAISSLQSLIRENTNTNSTVSQAISALTQGLQDFYATFDSFSTSQNVTNNENVVQLGDDIESLNGVIDQVNAGLSLAAAGVIDATPFFDVGTVATFPQFASLILHLAQTLPFGETPSDRSLVNKWFSISIWSISNECLDAEANIAADKVQIATLQQEASAVVKARSALYSLKYSIERVDVLLTALTSLGDIVNNDSQQLITFFSPDPNGSPLIKVRIPALFGRPIRFTNNISQPFVYWQAVQNTPCIYNCFLNVLISSCLTKDIAFKFLNGDFLP
ncbi:hypothetical protein M422DRAFT_52130 [Sphaerobolus stellatus SS14]|uniref:Karyogamy protein 5 n=1 Tax=Sphaerobolus stellatus (strain SS14) TaxID=990650 RepID=A0A0C9UXV5_SPHS4|nr:hypothetical protein M422DRAFT_52130 [Sphaerobolus stellatus SS14]